MKISELSLKNFRCYKNAQTFPEKGINLILGNNGIGKTSLLESISLLARLKSFREAKTKDVVMFGEYSSNVIATVDLENGSKLKYQLDLENGKKRALVNGKPFKYLSEYIGQLATVSFCPSDIQIGRGEPEYRRSWIDTIATIYFNYEHLEALKKYYSALAQRNSILKNLKENNHDSLYEQKEIYTKILINNGAKLIKNRCLAIENSHEKIERFYCKIAGKKSDLTIEYLKENYVQIPAGHNPGDLLELIIGSLNEDAKKLESKERVVGNTLFGPHRDDFEFLLNGLSVKSCGSQGELRTLILSLRLFEIALYKENHKLDPIILIDDFSSELDSERRGYLLEYISDTNSQVFITSTEKISLGKELKIFSNTN